VRKSGDGGAERGENFLPEAARGAFPLLTFNRAFNLNLSSERKLRLKARLEVRVKTDALVAAAGCSRYPAKRVGELARAYSLGSPPSENSLATIGRNLAIGHGFGTASSIWYSRSISDCKSEYEPVISITRARGEYFFAA